MTDDGRFAKCIRPSSVIRGLMRELAITFKFETLGLLPQSSWVREEMEYSVSAGEHIA